MKSVMEVALEHRASVNARPSTLNNKRSVLIVNSNSYSSSSLRSDVWKESVRALIIWRLIQR